MATPLDENGNCPEIDETLCEEPPVVVTPDGDSFFQPMFDALIWLFDQFYELLVFLLSAFMLMLGKLFYDISVEVVQLSWSIAQDIISDLSLSQYIQTAWTGIPTATRSMLAFFRVPEIINLLMSLGVTKFMLRFIPFM